jgi:excinuclease ABC subunit A
LTGDLHLLDRVEFVDQNPIGKSSRSNPVTYLKAFDEITQTLCQSAGIENQRLQGFPFLLQYRREEGAANARERAKSRWRCSSWPMCDWSATPVRAKRFKDEILMVQYREKSIYDILEMTINEALEFFGGSERSTDKKIARKAQAPATGGAGLCEAGTIFQHPQRG